MKNILYLIVSYFILFNQLTAQVDTTLKVHYSFDNELVAGTLISDVSGNNFMGTLKRGATIATGDGNIGGVLKLGDDYGYLEINSVFATSVFSKLEDYTISTYIYISEAAEEGTIFEFGNGADYMYYSSRYSYLFIGSIFGEANRVSSCKQIKKGVWFHLAITYNRESSTAKVYIDGVEVGSSTSVTIAPKDFSTINYSMIGGSSYPTAVCLTKTSIDDFRLYNVALPDSTIEKLSSSLPKYNNYLVSTLLKETLDSINLADNRLVDSEFKLPSKIGTFQVLWSSSDTLTISSDGIVNRPQAGEAEKNVTLTASIVDGDFAASGQFDIVIMPNLTANEILQLDADRLNLNKKVLHSSIELPVIGINGSVISWYSDSPGYLSDDGELLSYAEPGLGSEKVVLTATLTLGQESKTKEFSIYIAEQDPYSAYLFVYFKEGSEYIRFAISDDGYNYKALNNDDPVLDSEVISSTGGVRDPHILRGTEGDKYYMVATDMRSALGWDSNRGIVLMTSDNLIDWQSNVVNIATKFPREFSDIQTAWAPQCIYDSSCDRYMIYWSMQKGEGTHKIYYAYANSTFTGLQTIPKLLFEAPNANNIIDGDIIEKDSLFYLFYRSDSGIKGIKKAASTHLTGPYEEIDEFLDQNDYCVEGSCIFRLNNSDNYLMMYDAYCTYSYQFTQTADLNNFIVVDSLVTMDFEPKHGTVMSITNEEKEALLAKWNPSTALISPINSSTELVSTAYYNISGVYLGDIRSQLSKGIYIRKRTYVDGSVAIDKIFIND